MILRATLLFIVQQGIFTILFGKVLVWSYVISFLLYHWILGSLSETLLVVNNVIHCNNGRRISTKARTIYQDALTSTCWGSGSILVYFQHPFCTIHNLTDGTIKQASLAVSLFENEGKETQNKNSIDLKKPHPYSLRYVDNGWQIPSGYNLAEHAW